MKINMTNAENLVSAIIKKAANIFRKPTKADELNAAKLGYSCAQAEVLDFFYSPSFELYCDILDLSPDWVRKKAGINENVQLRMPL